MKLEVEAAVELIKRFVSRNDSFSENQVKTFCDHTRELLAQKFEGHWYDVDPVKGNGFRCMRINNQDPVEPTLLTACQLSGLQYKDLRLPRELTLWIDPCEVSCRIGEMRPQHFTIARVSKDGLQYLENRTRDIDIDDAERRHVESVRRTRSDLFSSTTSSSSTAVTEARAKAAAANNLAERRALATSSSSTAASAFATGSSPPMDSANNANGGADDSLMLPFYRDGGVNGCFENMDGFYGPLSSPPAAAKQLSNLPQLNGNGFFPTWNGIGSDQHHFNNFYADAQHAYAIKSANNNAAPNNHMRGRANSYRNGGVNGGAALRQQNSLSSSSPISNSNSNLSTSSNTTPPPNSQARFSPPSGAGHYQQSAHNNEQKRQPKSSGGMVTHPNAYTNMTPTSLNASVVSTANHPFTAHHQQHYNFQQRHQQQQGPSFNLNNNPSAALAFFPPSMASGPGIPPHQHLLLSPAHGPNHHNSINNMMPNHHNNHSYHLNHPYAVASHHSLIAQRSTAVMSSD